MCLMQPSFSHMLKICIIDQIQLALLGEAMSLAKTAGEMDVVLHCRSGWFCVCVRAHLCGRWGKDETVCMVWKRWG